MARELGGQRPGRQPGVSAGLSFAPELPKESLPRMPIPPTCRRHSRTWLCLLLGWPLLAGQAAEKKADRSDAALEFAVMERMNALWRLVRTDEEVPANLARLRTAGGTEEELRAMEPTLTELWAVPVERNFGWLSEETVRQIQAVDRQFVARMRLTRLYETIGIRVGGQTPVPVAALNRLWRSEILRVLDYDELAEFRLSNSVSAKEVNRRVQGLTLTADEIRTLFEWQREFDSRQGGNSPNAPGQPAWQQREQLDEWRRIRELLGDERFVVYLGRASPAFDRMNAILGRIEGVGATAALEVWWIRQDYQQARSRENVPRKRDELAAEVRTKVTGLIGEAGLAMYLQEEDGRWLAPRPPVRIRPRETPPPARP
jgi:hypothetical protein